MKELSLNLLDITENSTKALADLVKIALLETEETLTVRIEDNGIGMTEETRLSVIDPFYTTRTTRRVGMGIPLFKLAAVQTGGDLTVESRHKDEFPNDHGTVITAVFYKNHIDFTPLGDVISTLVTLIQGHPAVDFVFTHERCGNETVTLDTREIREVLEDVPIDSFEILLWIRENLTEQYNLSV